MSFWDSVFALVFGRTGPRKSEQPRENRTTPSPQPPVVEAPPPSPAPEPPVVETPPVAAEPAPPPEAPPLVEAAPEPAPRPAEPEPEPPQPQPQPDDGTNDAEPPREPAGAHDIGEDAEPPGEPAPAPPEPIAPPPGAAWVDGWNPAIPPERRLSSPNRRPRNGAKVSRVIVHITGTADFAAARESFMSPARQASTHYCIDRNGDLYQFVSEDDVAWHAGIHGSVNPVYASRDGVWRKYKRYFHWHKGYPADAVFLDRALQPCAREQAALVARADGSPWPEYEYFSRRWGEKPEPVGYEITNKAVNQHSIGIETVGHGGASAAAYTDAMYATLAQLVADICERHGIARTFGPVCGHEDVNPVERWGWDPGSGFDWSRVVQI